MPDTRDERGGDEATEVVGLLRSLPRTKITPETVTQHMIDRWYREKGEYLDEIRDLREQLAAATTRAESATVLPERWRALIAERDAATERAEKAERASRLLVVGQNELDRQWAETDAATRTEFEAAMNELRERAEKAESRSAALDHSGVEYRWILADGRESEFEPHNEGPCGCRREQRPVYVGDWRPALDAASTKQPTSLEQS